MPPALNFFTTLHPSASVTLAATPARTTFPYTGIQRSRRLEALLPMIPPNAAYRVERTADSV